MTNPPADYSPPPVADAGIAPPPDGVYPIPPAAVPTFDAQLPIYPDHPTYSPRRNGGNSNGGNQPAQSSNPPAPVGAKPMQSNNPPTNTAGGNTPNTPTHPSTSPPAGTPPSKPVGRPVGDPLHQNPVTPPKTPPPAAAPKGDDTNTKKVASTTSNEQDLYRQVLQDIDPKQPNFTKALTDLDAWSHKFPASSFANDRLYYYIHAYNGMSRPEQVLDTAATVVQTGVRSSYRDQQQVLQILVAASASVSKLHKPTVQQLATGQKAAKELLEFLPDYFAPRRKPSNVSDSAWSIARGQLEEYARQALELHPLTRVASAN